MLQIASSHEGQDYIVLTQCERLFQEPYRHAAQIEEDSVTRA